MAKFALTLESENSDYIVNVLTIAELLDDEGELPSFYNMIDAYQTLIDSLQFAVETMIENGASPDKFNSLVLSLNHYAKRISEIVEKGKAAVLPQEKES